MWRSFLKWAIKGAVASGLVDKAKSKVVGWLKYKFRVSVERAAAKLNAAELALERRWESLERDADVVEKITR